MEGYDISRKYRFVGAAVFTHGNGSFLLNSGLGISMILDETCLRPLLAHGALDDDLTFKLYQRGFIRERDGDREEDGERKRSGGQKGAASQNAAASQNVAGSLGGCPSGAKPNFFLINLTNNCNLRCRYCFRDIEKAGRDETADGMLLRICQYIVNYCREQGMQSFSVQPWGGEPMLFPHKIIWMQEFFRDQGFHPRFIMETNGTLIDENAAAQLSARHIRIGISIDGPAYLHDAHRPLADGRGSFEKVMAGLAALEKAGYGECGIITVISRQNIGKAEEILTYFAKEWKFHRVKLSLIKENTFSPESAGLSRIGEEELSCFYDTVLRTIVRLNREGYPIYERNICDKLVNLLRGRAGNICSAGM